MVLPRTGRWTNFRAEALGTENGPLLTSTMAVLLRREAARRSGALGCFIRAFTTNRARARRVLGGARHHCSLVCRPEGARYDRATTTLTPFLSRENFGTVAESAFSDTRAAAH